MLGACRWPACHCPPIPTPCGHWPRALQAELARKELEIAANAAEIHAKTLHIEKLKMQLAVLRRARFGRSSEKLDRDIEQLELLIGELEEEAAAEEARAREPIPPDRRIRMARSSRADDATAQASRPRRCPSTCRARPSSTNPPAPVPGCGGTVFSRVGEDEREVLEYVPASFKVIQHVRPKLSCRACETIVQAPMPSLPIERGRPGPGLLAHVLVSKYCDHLPLHRQSAIYAREGVELDRSTLADWVGKAVFLLTPLAEAIGRHVRAGEVLHADDTPVPVLVAGRGQDEDRAAVGGGARRAAVGIGRAACRLLSLLAGSQGHACRGAARLLPRLSACRRLCRVRPALRARPPRRRSAADRGRLLEPRSPQALRRASSHRVADRARGPGADRRPVRNREQRSADARRTAAVAARD